MIEKDTCNYTLLLFYPKTFIKPYEAWNIKPKKDHTLVSDRYNK